MIRIENLTKKFKKKTALDDITIYFDNCTYGLLGENGAGKTTLIRCITGLYSGYGGTISTEEEIGYLPQTFGAFKELTVREMMQFLANQKGLRSSAVANEISELLELVNLTDKADSKVGKLSGGMVRRLGIAQALLGNPDTVILDEPTAGLDPEERLRFKNIIQKIKKNKTIILSTHIVEDVDALCDKIAIMKNGKIIACDESKNIKNSAQKKVYEIPAAVADTLTVPFEIVKQFQRDDDVFYRILTNEFDETYSAEPTIEDGYLCAIKNI